MTMMMVMKMMMKECGQLKDHDPLIVYFKTSLNVLHEGEMRME